VFAVRRSLLEYLAEDPGPATALASDPPAARRT
jgi:hypothetical protein